MKKRNPRCVSALLQTTCKMEVFLGEQSYGN